MENFKQSFSRVYGNRKVIDSTNTKSFVDIKLKSDSSIVDVKADTDTGLVSGTNYTTQISINSSPQTLTIAGANGSSITSLVNAINSVITGGSAFFIEQEQVIRIQTTASGATAISVVSAGTLIDGLVGTKSGAFTASYRTPVVGGGIQVQLSNTASSDNPVYAMTLAQVTRLGVAVTSTKLYDETTGVLTIKGTFSVDDVVDVLSVFVK